MQHRVRIIDDDDLPAEVDWAFVRHDGALAFWLKRSVAHCPDRLAEVLEDAWGTFRRIDDDELMSWPALSLASSAC